MKTQKGMTMMSLVIYMFAMAAMVSIISIIITFFNHNIINMNYTGEVNLELNKFETQMIKETQLPGNRAENIHGVVMSFSSGNTYTYQNNKIYQNSIEIAKDVTSFSATLETNGDKQIIRISIKLEKGETVIEKDLSYVL